MPIRLFLLCFLLAARALPASALEKVVAAENLEAQSGATRIDIPKLTLEETPLTAAELKRLFDPAAPASLAERLAGFSAARARAGEIRGEGTAGERKRRFLYEDAGLEEVKAGRVGALRIARLAETLEEPGGTIVASYENLLAKGVDLPALARLLAAPRADDQAAAAPIIEAARVEKIALASKDGALSLRAAQFAASDLRLRGFSGATLAALSRPEGPLTGGAQDAALALGLIESIEFGALELSDLTLAGQDAPAGKRIVGARRLVAKGFSGGILREATMEGFGLDSADGGKLAVERLSLDGLDLAHALGGPGLGGLRFARASLAKFSGDTPDPEGGGRLKFSADSAEIDLGNFREGVPTKAAFRFQGFKIDLAGRGEEAASGKILRALGYAALEFSGSGSAEWREATRELEVSQLRLDSKDMGALTLAAKLSGVDAGVFNPNPLVAGSLLLAAKLDRLEATLEGGGLLERMLANEAKASGTDLAELRAEYADNLAKVVIAELGDDDKARRIADAIERYVANPKRLRIAFAAPKGFGALDLMKSFPQILQELEVEASAE